MNLILTLMANATVVTSLCNNLSFVNNGDSPKDKQCHYKKGKLFVKVK